MSLTSISSGIDTGFSTKFNNNFKANKIQQLYTSTGLDLITTSVSTTTLDSSSSLELTAVASSSLGGADYLSIHVLGLAKLFVMTGTGDDGRGSISIAIQTKQIGGAYSDSLAETALCSSEGNLGAEEDFRFAGLVDINYLHTLTAGEKSAGVQVKIIIRRYLYSDGGITSGYYTGKQVVLSTAV